MASKTVNGLNVGGSYDNSYKGRLQQSTVNGSRINGAFNSGTTQGNTVTNNSATSWKNWKSANTPKTTYVPPTGGGGDSSGGGGESYSGGGGGGYENSILDQIKSLLKEQQEASKRYYETMYNQRMNEINTQSENNRNLINKNYKRGERYLNSLYGNTDSGTNWTNRARNNQNWLSQLAQNRENATGLRDSAAAQRDLGLSNAANTLAQGWYNYVMPVMTNRQNYSDSLAYRNYLANL